MSRRFAGCIAITAVWLAFAVIFECKSEREWSFAIEKYRLANNQQFDQILGAANRSFEHIYENIRTIAALPSVQEIDRHGSNINDNARVSIQQIYNNLKTSVDVSEVYIVPENFEPDAIDPATGKPEAPVLMFDSLIAGASDAEGLKSLHGSHDVAAAEPEEVETYEYRQLVEQLRWLKANSKRQPDDAMSVPVISSVEIITCDNTEFVHSRADADRRGVILSVPFYGKGGNLRGVVAAIIRTNALRRLLPESDYRLLHRITGQFIGSQREAQEAQSPSFSRSGRAGPSLLYSRLASLSFKDGLGAWELWAGHPNSDFLASADAQRINRDRIIAFIICALLAVGCCWLWLHSLARRERELRQLRDLSDATAEGLIICEEDKIVAVNRSICDLTGREADALVGRPATRFFGTRGRDLVTGRGSAATIELELDVGSHQPAIPVEVASRTISYLGRRCRALAVRDLRERRKADEAIRFLAQRDPLTRLCNRHRFEQDLESALARTERGTGFAILCLDLDHFKQVNDTLGHAIGDKLLQAVANRLQKEVRKSDIVARLGGDEFAIIQESGEQPIGSMELAMRLVERISDPYQIDGHQVVIGTSVGIALAPSDGKDAAELMMHADLALYRSKADGRGVFRMFKSEMDAKMQARRRLELDLRQALPLKQFQMHYQPLIDATSNAVTGFEALLRWRHPDRGMVPPLEFIRVAEEMRLMGAIGAWVLKQACIDAMNWPSETKIAVNVSATQFSSRALDEDVSAALRESGLNPTRLELEITESVLLENSEATMALLHKLKALGVRIAMDDFGTGYSSLSYLSSFPFDKIKIDRSFTSGDQSDNKASAIVRAVVGLGTNLGMTTTAEGVETRAQLELLRAHGCTEVQGYLFSRPIPAVEIAGFLNRHDQTAPLAA